VSLKILLLEDDFEYRSSVSEYLTELGYEVDECESGDAACDKIAANAYHLLILDIKVPEVSGEEVLRYARSLGLGTPVMMMTSLGDIDDLSQCYELGCNEYLKSPFI
jgi:two component transcriptional regulator, winged helix family